jgi:SNF2 family DNA or RNA helicase
MPNDPTDIWAQQRLVDPSRVPKYFGRFRDEVMILANDKWVPKRGWEQIVFSKTGPAIRIATEDCVDLPECISVTREVPLSKEQEKAYDALLAHCMALHEEHQITAVNEGVLIGKLLQVTTGAVYSTTGDVVDLNPEHKLDALKEIIEEGGRKVIVFTPYVHSLKMLEKALVKDYSVETVFGGVSAKKREEIFKEFQHGALQVLVAHPECMAHGLTLTSAYTICWYTPIHSNEIYEQANGRITRIGQTKKQTVFHLVSSDLEKRIISKLKSRQKMQNVLLEMLK